MRICYQCGKDAAARDRYCVVCGSFLEDTSEAVAPDPLIGQVLGSGFALREVIGSGGMGRVYRAEQVALGRTVAVKIVHPHLLSNDQVVARFYQEARAASRLNHPNSVGIIDFGRAESGLLFLVMEYLNGIDLSHVVAEQGPLTINRICHIALEILDALEEAHAHNVVHRDLKPENIFLLSARNTLDRIKVVDFGLAMIMGGESSITQPGLLCGTPDYMSPEHAQGLKADGRADLYSLGVILFELLTGRLPFLGETPTQVILNHVNQAPPDPREVAPDRNIANLLADIVLCALCKDPAERYPNARKMRDDIVEFVEQSQLSANWMRCSSCDALTPISAKFCAQCGALLATGSSAEPVSRFSFLPMVGHSQRLIGRNKEWNELQELARASASRLAWVHIQGDTGTGKGRLAEELKGQFAEQGTHVVAASPHPRRALVSYYSVRELMRQVLGCPVAEWESRCGKEVSAIVRAGFEELIAPNGVVGAEGQSRADAVARALEFCIRQQLAAGIDNHYLLFLDSFERCDELSRRVVAEFSELAADLPVLILTTGVTRLSIENIQCVELHPWSETEAEQFVSSYGRSDLLEQIRQSPDASHEIYRPLFLQQAIRLRGSQEQFPTRLADVFVRRVEQLSNRARRLLQWLSIFGVACETAMLQEICGEEILESLGELVEHGLVTVDEREVTATHPYLVELLEASMPIEARSAMHQKVADFLGRKRCAEEELVEHVRFSDDMITRLLALERVGNRLLQRGAWHDAILMYRRGIDLARREILRTGDESMHDAFVSFSGKLAEAMCRCGQLKNAQGVLQEAIGYGFPDSPSTIRLTLGLAQINAQLGKERDALKEFQTASENAAERFPELEAQAEIGVGRLRRAAGDTTGAIAVYQRALDLLQVAKSTEVKQARLRVELAESMVVAEDMAGAAAQCALADLSAKKLGALALGAKISGLLATIDERRGDQGSAKQRYWEAVRMAELAGDVAGAYRYRAAHQSIPPHA